MAHHFDDCPSYRDNLCIHESPDLLFRQTYMDSIGTYISETDNTDKDKQEFFVPDRTEPDQQLTIIIDGAQEAFIATNWYITAAVTLLSGVIAYFLSGHTLKPLRRFASQVEQIHPNNLSDMKFSEDVLPEFQKFSSSFNRMLGPSG